MCVVMIIFEWSRGLGLEVIRVYGLNWGSVYGNRGRRVEVKGDFGVISLVFNFFGGGGGG